VNRTWRGAIAVTILVVPFAIAGLVLGRPAPEAADVGVTTTDSGPIVAAAVPTPGPTAAPVAGHPRATPRGKEIYKGHTLDEIRADPSLLGEILAEGDYIRPVHGEPYPPLHDSGSDHICPNHVECPSTGGSDAFLGAEFALMEASGSDCVSSHEGQMALESIDFEGMALELGSEGGVLRDGRGWVGTLDHARQHFGAPQFVAEDPGEHWFITNDPKTLSLLYATDGPAAAALIAVPLSDGRIVWYLGPRWFVSIPC
jgi:hypothetical protein